MEKNMHVTTLSYSSLWPALTKGGYGCVQLTFITNETAQHAVADRSVLRLEDLCARSHRTVVQVTATRIDWFKACLYFCFSINICLTNIFRSSILWDELYIYFVQDHRNHLWVPCISWFSATIIIFRFVGTFLVQEYHHAQNQWAPFSQFFFI